MYLLETGDEKLHETSSKSDSTVESEDSLKNQQSSNQRLLTCMSFK